MVHSAQHAHGMNVLAAVLSVANALLGSAALAVATTTP